MPSLARDVLNYFVTRPDAVDDAEGIARWRLLQAEVERTLEGTQIAIDWLIEEGFLRAVETSGGRTLYQLDPRRRTEALDILKVK